VRSSLKMPDRCIEMLLPLWSIDFWQEVRREA
jgi:hypothetical protein